jgi:hypothetical protein
MNTSIISAYDISTDVEKDILEAFNALKSMYLVEIDTDFTFRIKNFSSFHDKDLNYLGPVIKCSSGKHYIHINYLELILPEMGRASNNSLTYQVWATMDLKREYPRIIIRTETMLDKIHELINPIELDIIKDKEFSKKFFVLTEDRQKTELLLNPSFRNAILEIDEDEIVIEIKGSQLIIGNKKSITTGFAINASKFLFKLHSLLKNNNH